MELTTPTTLADLLSGIDYRTLDARRRLVYQLADLAADEERDQLVALGEMLDRLCEYLLDQPEPAPSEHQVDEHPIILPSCYSGENLSYLFSIGNSTHGPIGLCARISAATPEEALSTFREHIPYTIEHKVYGMDSNVEYVNVYVNHDAITLRDIEQVEDTHGNEVF